MKNVCVAFEALEERSLEEARRGQKLVGYQEIRCHMIFDIKRDVRFIYKARYFAVGHTTDPPSCITYSTVMSRDSTRIAFTLAAFNGVDIRTARIGNSYLNAK